MAEPPTDPRDDEYYCDDWDEYVLDDEREDDAHKTNKLTRSHSWVEAQLEMLTRRANQPMVLSIITCCCLVAGIALQCWPLTVPSSTHLSRACLLAAMPAATIWAARFKRRPVSRGDPSAPCVDAVRILACIACVAVCFDTMQGRPVTWVATIALSTLAMQSTGLRHSLKRFGSDYLPLECFLCVGFALLTGSADSVELGICLGSTDGLPLVWFGICFVLSTVALVGWSLLLVKGNHGPIQHALGRILTLKNCVPLATVNAIGEETEFRILICSGLWHMCDPSNGWLLAAIGLHSVYFATLHVAGGFPSGFIGGILVFVCSSFLGLLRWWTGGMALVLLLHIHADVVIFALIIMEQNARDKKNFKNK